MMPVKKIYIDSRQRVTDASNTANFKIELPYSYKMPDDTVFVICDVCIPHSWFTVEKGINRSIEFQVNVVGASTT